MALRCTYVENMLRQLTLFFLHCTWTEQLWRMFICLKEIRWVKPGSIKGILSSWNRDGNASDKEKRWKLVPACIWWTIWNERNNRSSENWQNSLQKIKMDCLALFNFWCKQDILTRTEDTSICSIVYRQQFRLKLFYSVSCNTFERELHFCCSIPAGV